MDTFNDIDLNECIFGYQDESHCNINENKMRIYYPLERRNIRYKTRKRITTSIMGYQSVNGQSILYFPKRSVTYYFMNFLLRVLIANIDNPNIVSRLIDIINDDYHSEESTISYLKERNSEEQMNQFKNNYIEYMRYKNGKKPTPKQIERKINSYKKKINPKDKNVVLKLRALRLLILVKNDEELMQALINEKPIVMALDNCRMHTSTFTLSFAECLNIDLRFLPKYSPQFNPIEQIWRSIKREISYNVIKNKKELHKIICKHYMDIIHKKSYYENWIQKYTKHKSLF